MLRGLALVISLLAVMLAGLTAPAAAQTPASDASPVASPQADPIEALFVINAASSTVAPSESGDGTFTVSLVDVGTRSVLFSDRPNRVVATIETAEIVAEMQEAAADNPVNIALVGQSSDGSEEIIVLEVLSAAIDENGTLTMQAANLGAATDFGAGLQMEPLENLEDGRSFTDTHVFVDEICWIAGAGGIVFPIQC